VKIHKYIEQLKEERIETLTLAILINDLEEACFTQIMHLAKSVKLLKIVTNKVNKFIYIEEKLYNDYGIAIQITNNKEKALTNVGLVINFDFNEADINSYDLLGVRTIVNIKNKIKINNLKFTGNIYNDYKMIYDDKLLKEFSKNPDFDGNILYESLIYKRDNFANIRKRIRADGVEFAKLLA